jgi:uncharacterized protein YukE
MGEGFRVHPHWLSGYAKLLYHETDGGDNGNVRFIRNYIDYWCHATDGYTGLMSGLKAPVDTYANAVHDRLTTDMGIGSGTADELDRATWVYLHVEKENTRRLDDGTYYSAPDAAAKTYPRSDPELPEPSAEIDFGALFEEFGKDVKDIDFFVSELLGWKVHRELIVDITGDWSKLAKAGEALMHSGDATETIAGSLRNGLNTLDANWDGAAAQGFVSMMTKYYEVINEESALNRTVGRAYGVVADEVKKVAGELVKMLNDVVKAIKSKLPGFWEGFWNMFSGSADRKFQKAAEYLCARQDLFNSARQMVDGLRKLIDQLAKLIDELKEPIKAAKQLNDDLNKAQEAADKINGKVDEVKERIVTAADLLEIADPHEFAEAPASPFVLPGNPEADAP